MAWRWRIFHAVQVKLALIGAGDLAFRIAERLTPALLELMLAGRVTPHRLEHTALLDASGNAQVRFVSLDALDEMELSRFFASERPDVIVQCASLLSPWLLPKRTDQSARLR
jgi:dTDP-4-dehydrorhamnose reductase